MRKLLLVLVIFPVMVAACGGDDLADSPVFEENIQSLEGPSTGGAGASEPGTANTSSAKPEQDIGAAQQTTERLVIRNANLTLTVESPAAAAETISALAEELEGWVVSSQINSFVNRAGEESTRGSISIRVPAERLDEALEQIKEDAVEVESEQVSGQDVTAEYVDLESQLGNLKAAEDQLQEIMQGAEDTEAVLSVYDELVRIRGEIDRIEGRMNFLSTSAEFSSITVTLNPPTPDLPAYSEDWSPGDTAEDAFEVLVSILQFGVDVAIVFIIVLLPFLLVALIPAVWLWRRWRKSQ